MKRNIIQSHDYGYGNELNTNNKIGKLELKSMQDVKSYISDIIEVDGLNYDGIFYEFRDKVLLKDNFIFIRQV